MSGISRKIETLIACAPFIWSFAFFGLGVFLSAYFFVPAAFYLGFAFWAPLGNLMIFGRLYWVTKTDKRWLRIGVGTMHTTSAPWRSGKGIYFVFLKRVFQIGLCKEMAYIGESQALLSAMKGRYLDMTPSEIGDWNNAVQKGNKVG